MKKTMSLLIALALACPAAAPAAASPAVEDPSLRPVRVLAATNFLHDTGRPGADGWEADQRVHSPGVLLQGPSPALLLAPGVYRATVRVRRGQYPRLGFLASAEQVVRIDVVDASDNTPFVSRELDVSELPSPNRYENRWVEFSLPPGPARLVATPIYWYGAVNAEIASVRIDRIDVAGPEAFAARARLLSERVRTNHLENGFVVSRKADGRPDEIGDATTYTGFYAASLAWRLSQEPSAEAEGDLENAMNAIHQAIKGDGDRPMIARFVDENGVPHPEAPSKDVYVAFFFACATAYPRIENEALKAQIRGDVRRIARRLLTDGFVLRGGPTVLASFAPHFTVEEMRKGIDRLLADRNRVKKVLGVIRDVGRLAPFQPIVPGIQDVVKALEHRDAARLLDLAVPTADGVVGLADRVIRVLKEHGRQDLIGPSLNRAEPAALRLANLLSSCLRKLPPVVNGRRFRQPSDLRILASNALISLHIVKTAAVITGDSTFDEYYRNNLYAQDALLKTALDWDGVEDDLIRDVSGNAAAARDRRGYLALLSAYNLYQLEKNPAVKDAYREILRKQAIAARTDDNPLVAAIAVACDAGGDTAPLLKALTQYPDSPDGLGDTYWVRNGKKVAERYGAGEDKGFSSEPLPVSERPRDSFLWQRNSRRLVGDLENAYPGADYLFLYWLARRHGLVPPPPEPGATARRP